MKNFILMLFIICAANNYSYSQNDMKVCEMMLINHCVDRYERTTNDKWLNLIRSLMASKSEEEIKQIRDMEGGAEVFELFLANGADSKENYRKLMHIVKASDQRIGISEFAESIRSETINTAALDKVNNCVELVMSGRTVKEITLNQKQLTDDVYAVNLRYNPSLNRPAYIEWSQCVNCRVTSGKIGNLESNEIFLEDYSLRKENPFQVELIDPTKPGSISINVVIGIEGESAFVTEIITPKKAQKQPTSTNVPTTNAYQRERKFNSISTAYDIRIFRSGNEGIKGHSSKETIGEVVMELPVSLPADAETFQLIFHDISLKGNFDGGDADPLAIFAFDTPISFREYGPNSMWKSKDEALFYKVFDTHPNAPFHGVDQYPSPVVTVPNSGKMYLYIYFSDSWAAAEMDLTIPRIELISTY